MRVLVLHSELGILRGGGENFTRNLFTKFAERGHFVAAAFVADPRGKYSIPVPSNIQPIPLNGLWSRNLGQAALSRIGGLFAGNSRLKKKWMYFANALSWRIVRFHNYRFRKRVENEFNARWREFDAVYVHGDAPLAARVASYRPTVLRLPGPVSFEAEPQLRAVHAVCANGDALATIKQFLGSHAIELPIGLDINLFSPGRSALRSKFGWTCQDTVVGYVGRLTRLKGVDLLASAFQEVSNRLPDAKLLIVGRGEEERNVRSILTKQHGREILHIERDVSHEQLPEWYRAMDILVMPSRYENFSNALIEAMSCKVPFIASDIGGNTILGRTGAGWLFEPGSVASLSDRLQTVLENSAERQRRGNIGLDYVKQHHSWMVTAQCLEDIFTSRLGLTQ